MFTFEPSENLRQFDARKFINKVFTIDCQHLSDDKKHQYVCCHSPNVYFSNWVNVLSKPKTKIRRKVCAAYIMEANNGGRSDYNQYFTYSEYFNENKKKTIHRRWKQDLMSKLTCRSPGDPERMEIILKFKDFEMQGTLYDLRAPEEWYSELWCDDQRFKFERGFYDSAKEAIEFFNDKPHDDIFGERYFPVIVFPKKTNTNVRSIASQPKSCSKPIVTKTHIIFGTRCKSYEFSPLIEQVYETGGKVARSLEWDWES